MSEDSESEDKRIGDEEAPVDDSAKESEDKPVAPTPADKIKAKQDAKKRAAADPRDGFNLEQRLAIDKMMQAFGPIVFVSPATGRVYAEGLDALTAKLSTALVLAWLQRVAATDYEAACRAVAATQAKRPKVAGVRS